MKKVVLGILAGLLLCEALSAQPIFWSENRNFGIRAGYRRANLNVGTFDVGYIDATAYFTPQLGWEFSAKIEYGKDYFSFSPVGLIGLPFWIYSTTHHGSSTSNLIGAIFSIASAKAPIHIWDWFEITPSWDFLKFTKVYDTKLKVNAEVGLELKFYPFCETYSMTTFFISPFCFYNFGYKKNASEYSYLGVKKEKASIFRGYTFGATIGMYF
ncbi:MAG: hypothetical protein ACI3ZQ_04605 [Candidatus Cryptobacteroides sp.]